ncbi:MAG: ABC transporter permease [Lachnospiraceae bacterium]|nr:ABC transporter permease [Lachnospiraceae bacterium]
MINHIKSEGYKLFLSNIYRYSLIATFILTLSVGVALGSDIPESFIDQTIPLVDIFFILTFLIVGYIWCTEYAENKLRYLLITSGSRVKLFIAKSIITYFAVTIMHLLYSIVIIMVNMRNMGILWNRISKMASILMFQWVILITIMSLLIFMAVVLKKYSHLTAFLIVLFLLFRWLSAVDIPANLINYFSYLDLHYRAIINIAVQDDKLAADILIFFSSITFPSLIAGFFIFQKQEF